MIGKLVGGLVGLAVLAGGAFLVFTVPDRVSAGAMPEKAGDPEAGHRIFDAAGCAGCHSAKGAKGEDRYRLGGGQELVTDFGTFRVPNVSPDPRSGIGGWSALDLANAMLKGVSPDGRHYYPAFPYTSYARMTLDDVVDLHAFMMTLPPVENVVAGHDLAFPFNVRRGLGLWKMVNLDADPVLDLPEDAPADLVLGRYLAEGPGHCGECHTPRDAMGGLVLSKWFAGAHNPDGEGRIPNITPSADGVADWSHADLVYSFESGFKPDFDSFGGQMVEVQENLSRLDPADRAAIATYLKAVKPLPDAVPRPATPAGG